MAVGTFEVRRTNLRGRVGITPYTYEAAARKRVEELKLLPKTARVELVKYTIDDETGAGDYEKIEIWDRAEEAAIPYVVINMGPQHVQVDGDTEWEAFKRAYGEDVGIIEIWGEDNADNLVHSMFVGAKVTVNLPRHTATAFRCIKRVREVAAGLPVKFSVAHSDGVTPVLEFLDI